MPEITGGGYQYPKAVLEAIGKRYLVEHWQSEDGSMWYDRYSDGWKVQGGRTQFQVGNHSVQLPIEFSTTNYVINATRSTYTDGNIPFARPDTTSSFICGVKEYGGSKNDICNWVAQGY